MFPAEKTTVATVPRIVLATALFVLFVTPAVAQNACADSVRGRIPWVDAKGTAWTAANLLALCKGAETSTEPGKCFQHVMSGTVSYGAGTTWNPSNALRLCSGALDANARVSCFEKKITQGIEWAAATDQCNAAAAPALDLALLAQRPAPTARPIPTARPAPTVKLPPVKSHPGTASTPPVCSGGDCDGDGFSATDDCDDNDASRYPGAAEVADFEGHDEDCNPATIGFLDNDGDGFVDSRVCNGTYCGRDCDDTRPAVNPNAAELPNRRDDNCNGQIDDDLEGWWNPAP